MSANKNDYSGFLDGLNQGENETPRDVKKRGHGLPPDISPKARRLPPPWRT